MTATRDRVSMLEWFGVSAGVLALVVSFLPWFRVATDLEQSQRAAGRPTSIPVWDGNFLAWFPIILLLAVSVLILWQRYGKPVPMVASLWLTLAILATVMILLRWMTLPEGIRSSYGLYLGLIVAADSAVAGFLAFRQNARA